MNILESIIIALRSILVHKLRAFLTLLSISIGVFAIVLSGTLITSLNNAITGEMASLGRNTIYITKMPMIQMGPGSWRKYASRRPLNYSLYKDFCKEMTFADAVSAYSTSSGFIIQSGDRQTDPNVGLIGADEGFFVTFNYSVDLGRPLTRQDIDLKRNVAVIGNDIVVKVFPGINPIGRTIRVKNHSYEVVGVLSQRGAMLGQSQDNNVMIPLTQFLKYYAEWWEESLTICVKAVSTEQIPATMDEAIGQLRILRNVKPWEENNFEVNTNDSIAEQFSGLTDFLKIFGIVAGSLALLAAGIGIMNIMLVTVKERTREIGVRKAVGAKRSWILYQFIIEAVTLSQIGGLIGIFFGVIAGGALGSSISISISIPFFSIVLSILICTALGVVFGGYPAWKAAQLDPIECLRYE